MNSTSGISIVFELISSMQIPVITSMCKFRVPTCRTNQDPNSCAYWATKTQKWTIWNSTWPVRRITTYCLLTYIRIIICQTIYKFSEYKFAQTIIIYRFITKKGSRPSKTPQEKFTLDHYRSMPKYAITFLSMLINYTVGTKSRGTTHV